MEGFFLSAIPYTYPYKKSSKELPAVKLIIIKIFTATNLSKYEEDIFALFFIYNRYKLHIKGIASIV